MSKFAIVSVLLYVLCMAAVIFGLRTARSSAIRSYGSDTAATDWQEWRAAATQQSDGEGPVSRRAPKSEQPPALMLMTEHFATCLSLSLLLTSVLYATLIGMVHGAYRRPLRPDETTNGH